jgi:hypothetical protein
MTDQRNRAKAKVKKGEREAIKNMIDTKEPAQDWGVVEIGGKPYFIQYVL